MLLNKNISKRHKKRFRTPDISRTELLPSHVHKKFLAKKQSEIQFLKFVVLYYILYINKCGSKICSYLQNTATI